MDLKGAMEEEQPKRRWEEAEKTKHQGLPHLLHRRRSPVGTILPPTHRRPKCPGAAQCLVGFPGLLLPQCPGSEDKDSTGSRGITTAGMENNIVVHQREEIFRGGS